MARFNFTKARFGFALIALAAILNNCTNSAKSHYWGRTQPPPDNILRYISGPEPPTLDPQISTGQPEARMYLALYEGLVEYDPKTLQPIPEIAESWEISPNVDEFLFHLRNNARWSDGTPITAKDFVYSLRRGFAPETASRSASLGYFIEYAEAFNSGAVFVKKNGKFFLTKDFAGTVDSGDFAPGIGNTGNSLGAETEFHKFVKSPARLVLDGDEKARAKQIDANPKLKAAIGGADFVPVKGEDIGIEAVDDYTLRLTLRQPAPFFLGLLAHQFFRLVPRQAIEKFGKDWTRPENIVTSGPFKVKEVSPYNVYYFEKDPNYWDAANVHLAGIKFYPVEEQSTTMNLYKAGEIDAFLNHFVPASWVNDLRQYEGEYLNFPENSTAYYSMNTTKAPFDNKKVRQAFSLAVNRESLAKFRKVTKPLYFQTPSGIFPDYDKAMAKVGEDIRRESGISPENWQKQITQFDPETARRLLTEAGFPVQQNGSEFSCPNFPTDKVSFSYNTGESNRQIAEFVQAQWKQNLGVTIPLKNMESKAFLPYLKGLQYDGLAQTLWSGDYMDPYTFLGLQYGKDNDGASGYNDPKYNQMLDAANAELNPQARYEKLARAEYYLLDQLPAIPLTVSATNWMKKPYVKGMYPNPGTLFPWKFVYIEHDPNKWDKMVENIIKDADPQIDKQLQDINTAPKQNLSKHE